MRGKRLLYAIYWSGSERSRPYVVKTYVTARGFDTKVIHEGDRGFKAARALARRSRQSTCQKVG